MASTRLSLEPRIRLEASQRLMVSVPEMRPVDWSETDFSPSAHLSPRCCKGRGPNLLLKRRGQFCVELTHIRVIVQSDTVLMGKLNEDRLTAHSCL
nr:hypothetical protein Iba_chr06aCG13180 [Ipomoea batatas]